MRAALQHFPRGNWARRVALALVLGMPVAIPSLAERPELSEEEARQELKALRDTMEAVQERIAVDRERRSEVEKRIESLDRAIARLAAEVRRIEAEQAEVRGEIQSLEERTRELRQQIEAQKVRVAGLAYSTYVMGRQSRLKLFLNQRDPSVINRMLGYHEYIVAARSRTIDQINRWAAEVAALTREQQARQSELEALAAARRTEQEKLEARRRERETALAALKQRITASESELSRLEENEKRLQEVLREIREYLESSRSRTISEGAFRGMKGRLRLPVSAPIAAGFGQRRSTGVTWDGIMFRPDSGAEVKSIFEGRVVFADWLRGFGLLLIIDHGDAYMSLYSHNESLFKQVGDWVNTEEVIATVGTSGGLDEPGLYFEIRNNGEPQDPLSWCQRG